MAEEATILGVWTEEEFKDTLLMAAVVAIVSFITTFAYRYFYKRLGIED